MAVVTLARHAMATRFEMVLYGEDSTALRAAGEEALEEIERLEAQLSLYRPTSEIAHLNARASLEPFRVTPRLFRLLQRAQVLSKESGGTFDITIAPLVRCWGFMGGTGQMPTEEALARARQKVGMDLVELNPADLTVRFLREGMMLDLGAIGKGYAIEEAAELLREAGVTSGLVHGGTSTIYALGHPPGADGWQIGVTNPQTGAAKLAPANAVEQAPEAASTELAAMVLLKDEAMSVSAVWGKFFQQKGEILGHIIDPRTGRPASKGLLAVVVLRSATESDALSTALLTVGPEGHDEIANLREGMRSLVVGKSEGQLTCRSKGIHAKF